MERVVANMCNYSSYVRNHAYKDGMQQGMQQGAEQKELSNIRSFMKSMNMPAKAVMDALEIPPEQQAKYAAML